MTGEPSPTDRGLDDDWEDLVVPETFIGSRLDRALASLLPGVGRKLAGRLCEQGDVLVDNRPAKKSWLLARDARLTVRMAAWGEAQPAPQVEVEVRWESADFVVVEKPAGLPTCAVVASESRTLAGALLARYPEMKDVGYSRREPGVLHRLDQFTSGLLVAARTQRAFSLLKESLQAGLWTKKYLALVTPGLLAESGSIETPLAPDPRNRRRVVEAKAKGPGHPCRTEYRVIQRTDRCDVVEVSAGRAYRHQVRSHLALLKAPLLGDELYGGPESPLSPRHALHASYIACAMGDVRVEVESPLPPDLSKLLEE